MFENLQKLPDDPILRLSQMFKTETRTPRLDVGVGIFQDENGETPIMKAVKNAEKRLFASETSKKYLGILGNLEFNAAIQNLVFSDVIDKTRIRGIQATAGTGAVRLIAEVLRSLSPHKSFHVSEPTWGNHYAIFAAAGFTGHVYPYYNRKTSVVDTDKFFATLETFGENDFVLFHGCCHNPSGADLTHADWDKVAEIAARRKFLPIVDLAYLGFGKGIDADAYGVRKLAASVETMFVAVSCSKNFGLYRERVGEVLIVAKNEITAEALQTHFAAASRAVVSMPPNHGAAIVAEILNTPELRAEWQDELTEMCAYMNQRRVELVTALEKHCGGDWKFITDCHRGMFTLLPLGKERVERLRNEFAIYIVGEGRINIAGLKNSDDIEFLANSIKKVL